MKKIISIALCSIALLFAIVIPTYAIPSHAPNTNWESGVSGPLLTYEHTRNLVLVCESQYNLSSPQYYVSFSTISNRRTQSTLICLTREYKPNYGGLGRYFAYVAFTAGDATNVGVSLIPEEWGQPGASLPITFNSSSGNGSVVGYVKLLFNPRENGGFYPVGVYTSSTITLVNNQYDSEQVVYLYSGAGVGYNDLYTTYGSYQYSSTIDKWIDAYSGYENGVGSTSEELESAYENGYMDGEQSGYHQGAQDGYANGYAHGYDEGYSFSAGAEEIESAYADGKADGVAEGYANGYDVGYDNGLETGYADGKADGITEGYQNGKADGVAEGYANGYDVGYDNGLETGYADGKANGVAEGYANGYDVGYDNGLETGYADGKADGITEGYQNGKADGVAEGYANGYDVGYDNGLETGYADGKVDGITEGYQNGKVDGVAEGYANGYTAGYDTGYETGYDEGYDYGYNLGEGVGSTKIDIGEIISAVPEGAKSIINGALGFEIFGINVAGTLTALLVVAIVAFVVKKLMTR